MCGCARVCVCVCVGEMHPEPLTRPLVFVSLDVAPRSHVVGGILILCIARFSDTGGSAA